MMGCSFDAMIVLWSVLITALVLGFAYMVWVFSAKESAATKLIGRIIAIVIVVIALILFLCGLVCGGRMKSRMGSMKKECPMMMQRQMGPKGEMGKQMMMEKMMEKGKEMKGMEGHRKGKE